MQFAKICFVLVTLTLAPAVPLAAQGDATLTVQVANVQGARDVTVSRSTGAIRESLGRVAPGAPLVLDMNRINFGKGKRVTINAQREELILIEAGTTDQRCVEARRGDRRDWCEEVAVVTWGESALLGLSNTAGVIRMLTRPDQVARTPRLRVGIDVQTVNYYRLEDVACDDAAIPGLTGCEAGSRGMSIGANLEYALSGNLSLGLGYTRSSYDVDQVYGEAPVRHEVHVSAFDLYGRMGLRPGAVIRPWGILGMSYYDNSDDVYWDGEPFDARGQGGPRILVGGGVDLDLARRFDARLQFRAGGGAERDADSRWGVGLGLGFHF